MSSFCFVTVCSWQMMLMLLLALTLMANGREDVSAPVRPGEKSTRAWEQAARQQEEDEEERAKVREMGGSDNALVNVLEGEITDGKIHPVGDRTSAVAMTNLTQVGMDFLTKIGLEDDVTAKEKVIYWLNQGAGHYCDACKYMMEESHRRVMMLAQEKIKQRDTASKDFQGGRGHEIKMDDEMKTEIAGVCDSQQYASTNVDARNWCTTAMKGRHSAQIFTTLTQGSFGYEDLLKRQNTVCGPQVMNVCPDKPWLGTGLSDCRACAEAFQDFDRILQQDRRDIDVGAMGIKAHKKSVKEADRKFRGRHHVWQKSQELCSSAQQRHPAKAASVIQEMCEEVLEEYESQVIRAFVDGGHQHPGASAEEVCVTISDKCSSDEFDAIRTQLASYHLPAAPFTQPIGEGKPRHTEL